MGADWYLYELNCTVSPCNLVSLNSVVLLIVVSFSMGKNAVEDLKRHEADKKTNNGVFCRLNKNAWVNGGDVQERVLCQVHRINANQLVKSCSYLPVSFI